jgi:ABC-type sugar transport system ATPase subunit
MGAKEGALILEVINRLREQSRVAIVLIAHNYAHVLGSCDRINLLEDGRIALDKPASDTSVEELTEIIVEEYRRARPERRDHAVHA